MLTVSIQSFSFLNGSYPADISDHGGGFVFDCRCLPNPGKLEKYSKLSGKNNEIIELLDNSKEVYQFITATQLLIDQYIEYCITRNFNCLVINFGCTGGQHRSVYCAEKLAGHIFRKYSVQVRVNHREELNWSK